MEGEVVKNSLAVDIQLFLVKRADNFKIQDKSAEYRQVAKEVKQLSQEVAESSEVSPELKRKVSELEMQLKRLEAISQESYYQVGFREGINFLHGLVNN